MMSPQLATAPRAQLACRLGGDEMYPCAEAGWTATNREATTAETVRITRAALRLSLMKLSSSWGTAGFAQHKLKSLNSKENVTKFFDTCRCPLSSGRRPPIIMIVADIH